MAGRARSASVLVPRVQPATRLAVPRAVPEAHLERADDVQQGVDDPVGHHRPHAPHRCVPTRWDEPGSGSDPDEPAVDCRSSDDRWRSARRDRGPGLRFVRRSVGWPALPVEGWASRASTVLSARTSRRHPRRIRSVPERNSRGAAIRNRSNRSGKTSSRSRTARSFRTRSRG